MGHDHLGRRRAVVLLGDGDPARLPQATDLPLAGLEDQEVDIPDRHARVYGVQDEAAGGVPIAGQEQPQVFPGDHGERPALREEAVHLRRGFGEPPQGRFDVAGSGVRLVLGQPIPEDVPQAGEVLPHVFRADGGDGHHPGGPGDVVGEEGRTGGQEGPRELGEVVLGVLDALLPAPLAVPVPKLRVQGILSLDDGLRDRPAAGMDRSAGDGFGAVHLVARISCRPASAAWSESKFVVAVWSKPGSGSPPVTGRSLARWSILCRGCRQGRQAPRRTYPKNGHSGSSLGRKNTVIRRCRPQNKIWLASKGLELRGVSLICCPSRPAQQSWSWRCEPDLRTSVGDIRIETER